MRTASPRGQKVGPRARVVTRERLPYLGTRGAKTAYYDRIRDGMGPSEAERSRASRGSVFQTHHLSAGQPGEHARASPGAAAPGGGDAANDDDIQILLACL